MLTDVEIQEAAAISGEPTGSRYKVRLIEGNRLGSSGYYPAETLIKDGPRIFSKGTPMFFDHQTAEEKISRPHGRLMDWAGELAEDAYYDNDGLYADIEVFEHHRPTIKALQSKIGLSIRASARTEPTVIDGKRIPVIKELIEARSVDFVRKAGAGGMIVSILESATEDDSELQEGNESMDEVLEELKKLRTDFDTRLSAIEEAAKPVVEEVKEEAKVDYDKVLEIAEELSKSTLDEEGRSRVLTLHRADDKKTISELIAAEESYVKTHVTEEVIGHVEDVQEDSKVTEFKLPSVWKKK